MKRLSYLFFALLIACKPDVTPEPDSIEEVSTIMISDVDNVLEVGEEVSLMATLITGTESSPLSDQNWTSTDASIGEIVDNSSLLIKKEGVFVLIVVSGELSDSLTINAISPENEAKSIEISMLENEISISKTIKVSVAVFDKNQNSIASENTEWLLTDPTIGSISSDGVFTPSSYGYTEVYAKSNGLISDKKGISVFKQGTFVGKENHSASGDVILVIRNQQLTIETQDNFTVQSGPDLRVFLSNIENGKKINAEALELSLLSTNSGKATYAVPTSVGIDDYKYINIHCKRYNTTFGSADLNK